MDINLKNNSSVPLYMQIYNQIKEQILYGKLKCGDKLPSYREFAKLYGVSIVTIKKAYDDLIKDQLITTSQTGCFVSEKSSAIAINYHMQQIEKKLNEIVLSAKAVEVSIDEIHAILNELWLE